MTSFSVQKRAKPQPTQAVCHSRKNLAAVGVDFKTCSTLVSEISDPLFMMNIEYLFSPGLSLRWRKEGDQSLFFQTICDPYQFMWFDDPDLFPARPDDPLPLPFAEQAADRVKRCAGHLCHILP